MTKHFDLIFMGFGVLCIALIAMTNTPPGAIARMTFIAPLVWLHVITADTGKDIAIDWHI